MNLDLLDYKIIQIFYQREDWDQVYHLSDFSYLGVEPNTLRNHLKKLTKEHYIIAYNTYPRYWAPVLNNEHRTRMEKIYNQPLKAFLNDEKL